MADPGGQGVHHQAFRRQYEGSDPRRSSQQHYYPPYGMPYNGYPHQMTIPQYQHNVPPQAQWAYYNTGGHYTRSHHPYQPYPPYPYQHVNSFHQNPSPYGQHSYPSPGNNPPEPLPEPTTPRSVTLSSRMTPVSWNEVTLNPPPLSQAGFSGHKSPYYPPLPWYSVPEEQFPKEKRNRKRRGHSRLQPFDQPVQLPIRQHALREAALETQSTRESESTATLANEKDGAVDSNAAPATGTPESLQSGARDEELTSSSSPSDKRLGTPGSKSVVIPVVPHIASVAKATPAAGAQPDGSANNLNATSDLTNADPAHSTATGIHTEQTSAAKPSFTSWAALLRAPKGTNAESSETVATNTLDKTEIRSDRLGRAVSSFVLHGPHKLAFLEPRGLVNSGNMCYMNSILQALIFCVPFYNFLSHVSRHVVYSFKSDTPMLDALIMFMKEFVIIDSAETTKSLRLRLKPMELEQIGESLLPEYVYEEIRRMPRFATMQRGHQQDAEEFLGFLFEELQGECAKAVQRLDSAQVLKSQSEDQDEDKEAGDGWLEVGPKQKASMTRSSGGIEINTPINQIFGGQLRSELRVPGAKNSVTLEPYQSLQLDIGSPEVRTIIDALKGMTKPEVLHGDFHSPRGSGATATKQVFIEAVPPVLILHLKRFQYDNTGGTQKIWKNIGYPLHLELPKEVIPPGKRASFALRGGMPKYRLTSVIYHHGKSATAGHYTTDILRQDGQEWLRIDDTSLRRVRSHDVVSAGEDTSKALAAALEEHRKKNADPWQSAGDALGEAGGEEASESGWSQARTNGKRWSGVVDGTAKSSGVGTPTGPQSLKDNKVAYILFYERCEA